MQFFLDWLPQDLREKIIGNTPYWAIEPGIISPGGHNWWQHFDLGIALYHQGKLDEAMKSLEIALNLDQYPSRMMIQAHAAMAEHRLGNVEQAKIHFKEVDAYLQTVLTKNQGRYPPYFGAEIVIEQLVSQAREVMSRPPDMVQATSATDP